jgi:thioredoxin 1
MKVGKSGTITLLGMTLIVLLVMAGCAKGREEQKQRSQEAATEATATPGKLETTTGTNKPAAPETGTADSVSASGKAKPVAKANKPAPPTSEAGQEQAPAVSAQKLPRLVDVGRGTCIPCKMMAPILEELKKEYSGVAVVEVIDLRYNSRAAMEYHIRVIPTQIFFDREGKEVWRHQGFMSKDAITAKFKEMGVALGDS